MLRTIDYEKLSGNYIMIDVRSPGEFAEATIPGSVCMPIFSDEERSRIGTVYVNESVEKAKQIGIEAVSARLPAIFEEISALNKIYDKLVFFCAKGGMRSSAVAALFGELGIKAYKLKGGYKGYRAFVNRALPEIAGRSKFIVIHGKTGVGKTDLLECLKKRGLCALDLERAANHRGSLLGNVGLGRQNSQKQFESCLYEELRRSEGHFIFIEGESKRIGNIIIPGYIFDRMEAGLHILAEAEPAYRVKRLTAEYGRQGCRQELLASLSKLERYIGKKNVARYVEMLEAGRCETVAEELMLNYYDPMYENEFGRYEYQLTVQTNDIMDGCDLILSWYRTRIDNIGIRRE